MERLVWVVLQEMQRPGSDMYQPKLCSAEEPEVKKPKPTPKGQSKPGVVPGLAKPGVVPGLEPQPPTADSSSSDLEDE